MIVRLYSVIEIFSAVLCLFYLYNRRFRFNLKNIIVLSLDVIFISAINEFHLPHEYTMVFDIILILYCGFEFGFHIKQIIINILLTVVVMCLVQTSGVVAYVIIWGDNNLTPTSYLIINTYTFIIMVCIIRRLRIYRISNMLQEQDVVNFVAMALVGTIILIYLIMYKKDNSLNAIDYLLLLVCIGYICILTALWKKYKNISLEKEIELKTHQIYENSYRNMIEDIKAKQHDFDNHINTIMSQHYVCHDYESLVQKQSSYIKSIQKNNRYNKVLISGDSVVVGFLYGKFLEADKHDILVTYKLDFNLLDCNVPDFRLIELLGNLFDNAVEAVLKSGLKKEVNVSIVESDDKIQIEVGNISPEIDRNQIALFYKKKYSRKGNARGYGLYNVKNICEQYHIQLMCENVIRQDDNWITFKLQIKKPICDA